MTVWLYTVCRNEELLMPYFLRHYSKFVDRIIVYDANSTDRTREIVSQQPQVELRRFDYCEKFDDVAFVEFTSKQYLEARGRADWVIWVDADEFLFHNNITALLNSYLERGITLPLTQGYSMVSKEPPRGNLQIY